MLVYSTEEMGMRFTKPFYHSTEWRREFAWFPVLLGMDNGQEVRVWLDYYEVRNRDNQGLTWEYRPVDPPQGFQSRVDGLSDDM
jgi:hypothetical protein